MWVKRLGWMHAARSFRENTSHKPQRKTGVEIEHRTDHGTGEMSLPPRNRAALLAEGCSCRLNQRDLWKRAVAHVTEYSGMGAMF